MADISIRKIGQTGRITFTRPKALNALSYDMCIAIEDALDAWASDDDVKMIVIDAEGEKAFCAAETLPSFMRPEWLEISHLDENSGPMSIE